MQKEVLEFKHIDLIREDVTGSTSKDIIVGSSSVIELKAELSKQEAEYKKEKSRLGNTIQTSYLTKLKVL